MTRKPRAANARFWLLPLCFVFLLGGCVNSATPIAYVHSVPPEQTCTLNIATILTVTEFDGQEVKWRASGIDAWGSVQIPQGSHTFLLDYQRYVNDRRHFRNGVFVRYDGFKAGHTYEMIASEGAEAGGFLGLFTNPLGAMLDTFNQALRIGIRDTTGGQDGEYTWLEILNNENRGEKGYTETPPAHLPTPEEQRQNP